MNDVVTAAEPTDWLEDQPPAARDGLAGPRARRPHRHGGHVPRMQHADPAPRRPRSARIYGTDVCRWHADQRA